MEKTNGWIEINYDNLQHNVNEIKKLLPKKTTFMAVVKANAYGHGMIPVSKYLNSIGVTSFAVARIEEAIDLRKAGIVGEILVLGYTPSCHIQDIYHYDIIQTIVDYEHARELESMHIPIKVHVKVDTGMHRLGIHYLEVNQIMEIFRYRFLQVEGIYTHLCVCDSQEKEDIYYTKQQIADFYKLISILQAQDIKIPKTHIQSSYGVLNYPNLSCDYARIGIAMYGTLSSNHQMPIRKINLQPVLSIKANIVSIRTVPAGKSIGYGRSFVCHRTTQAAVIPVGYADGIPRNFSSLGGFVLINGQKAPIIGRICMDQMILDISQIQHVTVGTTVTVMGRHEKEEIHVANVATMCDTITNELLSRLSHRLPRLYLKVKQNVS